MPKPIDELVKMHDLQTLYELMAEDEDWMNQLDAAEGLVKLGDRRGYDFLMSATESEEREVRETAREILDEPEVRRMGDEIQANRAREHQARLENARKRLQQGKPVFRYKMLYLPAGDLLSEDISMEGFNIPALDDMGLEGWEVVNLIPRRTAVLVGSVDDHFVGAYLLLKRLVTAEESPDPEK